MTLEELKKQYAELLAKSETEKRSLTAAEVSTLDKLKTDIAAMEKANADAAAASIKQQDENRSAAAAAAQSDRDKTYNMPTNDYLRSIAKGADATASVGNKEVIADVVRQFNAQSPIFAAHGNVQKRSTGNAFSFTKIVKGSSDGGTKTEGNAGASDTTSTAPMVPVPFKTYTGESILVTQEALDDYAADIGAEVIGLGMSKSSLAFGADCITALKSAFLVSTTFTPTETAASTWALSDVIAAYYEIPARNRRNVKFTCAPATAKNLVSLLTLDNSPQAAAIGLTKENIVEDDAVPADVLFVGDITLALAIGMKIPVRIFKQEVSAGTTMEVQPRLAVALRDATALACRKLKAA
jgi:HK97 family phage major capsid protein